MFKLLSKSCNQIDNYLKCALILELIIVVPAVPPREGQMVRPHLAAQAAMEDLRMSALESVSGMGPALDAALRADAGSYSDADG